MRLETSKNLNALQYRTCQNRHFDGIGAGQSRESAAPVPLPAVDGGACDLSYLVLKLWGSCEKPCDLVDEASGSRRFIDTTRRRAKRRELRLADMA